MDTALLYQILIALMLLILLAGDIIVARDMWKRKRWGYVVAAVIFAGLLVFLGYILFDALTLLER